MEASCIFGEVAPPQEVAAVLEPLSSPSKVKGHGTTLTGFWKDLGSCESPKSSQQLLLTRREV